MPQILITRDRNRRGFILIVHAAMVFFTILIVGLAVDAGTMYVIKGRLSSAVDAAALAAGRSVNLANTIAAAQTAASATATQFFNANFPTGYLGTGTMTPPTVQFTQELDPAGNIDGVLNIAVTASVPAPLYFMRALNALPGVSNFNSVTVAATGTASRRSTVMMLVLDMSTSMMTPTSPTACDAMLAATRQFITNFSPFDKIGVVTFTYTASLLYAPDSNFLNGGLDAQLHGLYGGCTNNTNTTSALYLAYEQIKSVGLPLAYNSIVLFTDGSPNGITANFPVRTQSDVRYGTDIGGTCPSQSALCTMPVKCPSPPLAQTVTGTIAQGAGQTNTGAGNGLYLPITGDPGITYTGTSCTAALTAALPGQDIRQVVAYIPDFDKYGNSTHGVPATSTPLLCPGSTCTVSTVTLQSTGGSFLYDTRDFWEFHTNNICFGSSVPACATDSTPGQQWVGGRWASFPTGDPSQSNFFTSGPYVGYMRPDQPTTIVAASMNTAMSEAYNIRIDASGCGINGTVCPTLFHPVINTIYLTGNLGDAADHEFLPIMSNTPTIIALPYDNVTYVPYTNPAYQLHQESGLYQVTANPSQLSALFAKLASEVLRLSN